MEAVLSMKLTDLAILAQAFFISILVVVHVKSDVVHNRTIHRVMYNNVMDTLTEDSLVAGFVGVDGMGQPKVKLEKISGLFRIQTDMYGKDTKHIICYVDNDGVYFCTSYEGYVWSDKFYYTNGVETLHEEKVVEVVELVKDRYGIDLSLSYNDGESWSNTIEEYTLFSISYDRALELYCFSGAKIHKKEINN